MVAIYTRQSKEKKDSVSIADQIERGEQFAKELGKNFKLYDEGAGQSAANETFENRPMMRSLLGDIEDGNISLVWALDEARISRNENTKLIFKTALKSKKVFLYTDKEGKIDFNDLNDEFFSGMRTLIAQQHIRTTSRNVVNSLLKSAKEGRAMGGALKPLGYKKGEGKMLVIDEDEAFLVKEIFNLYLQGYGTPKIAEILNFRKIPTKGSKYLSKGLKLKDRYTGTTRIVPPENILWAGNTILSILKNTLYIGKRKHKDFIVSSPQIIDDKIFEQVQKRIEKNKYKGGKIEHDYLLNDLCFCGRCNSPFRGKTRTTKRDHVYYCASKRNNKKNCGIRSINIDYLNDVIWQVLSNSSTLAGMAANEINNLNDPKQLEALREEAKGIKAKIALEEKKKNRVMDLYTSGAIEALDEATQRIKELSCNIKILTEQVENLQTKIDSNIKADELFDENKEFDKVLSDLRQVSDFKKQYDLVRLLIKKINIDFDDATENFTLELLMAYGGRNYSIIKNQIQLEKKGKLYQFIPECEASRFLFGMEKITHCLPTSSTLQHPSRCTTARQILIAFKVFITSKKNSNKKSCQFDTKVKILNIEGASHIF